MKSKKLSRSIIIGAMFAAITLAAWVLHTERQWRQFVAQIPKLSELLEPLPEVENAAPLYYAAIDEFNTARPVLEKDPTILVKQTNTANPIGGDPREALLWPTACPCNPAPEVGQPMLDQEMKHAFARYFAAAQPGFDLLEEADAYERFRMKEYSDAIDLDVSLDHLAPMRDLARQMAYRARWLQLQGDYAGAIAWIERGLRLSNRMADDATYISFLVRSAMAGIAIDALHDLLCAAGPDLNIPSGLVPDLQRMQTREQFALPLLTERAIYQAHFAQRRKKTNPFTQPFEIHATAIRVDRYLAEAARVASLPDFQSRRAALEAFPEWKQPSVLSVAIQELREATASRPNTATGKQASDYSLWEITQGVHDTAARAPVAVDRFIAQAALAEIGVYLHRYRAQYGRFPETLDALIPQFAELLPEDPFSDKPFVYKPADGEYILYSLGMNYQDDDGVHDYVDGDIVWCISETDAANP